MSIPSPAAPNPDTGGRMIALDTFTATPVNPDPFDHVIVPGFIRQDALAAVNADYPVVDKPGSFPTRELRYGPAFQALLDEIQGPAMTAAFAAKFDMDLTGHPTMVTARGRARAQDGQIHTDSVTKLITVLIYMNPSWERPEGRLRLLRGPETLDNPVAEVPPMEGTLLAFRNGPTAWHGHTSFEGPRRVIQLNWVRDEGVVRREQFRHALSAKVKRLNPFG